MNRLLTLFDYRWPNFEPWEVLSSDGMRAWIDKGMFVLNLDALNLLQRTRDLVGYPVHVNGYLGGKRGYRSSRENSMIRNSAEFSRHVAGDAFDISVSEMSTSDLFDAVTDIGWTGVKEYSNWVHVDLRPVPFGNVYRERLKDG